MIQPWEESFLYALADSGNVSLAARFAEVPRCSAYAHRNKDERFAELWDDAIEQATDALELEARRRAKDGVNKPLLWQGMEVMTVKEYSDLLLIFLLKAHRPKKFRDNKGYELEEIIAALPPEHARSVREALGKLISTG